MSWTRLDDGWTDRAALADLSFEDRWHYLALIQHCSRTNKLDGVVRRIDALRCSDHPNPASAMANLDAAGLVTSAAGDGFVVIAIEEHVPPPSVRRNTEQSKLRMRRKRAHDSGDHSQCKSDAECVTVTPGVTRNVGTGRDRTGRDRGTISLPTTDWPVVTIPTDPMCEVCTDLLPAGSPTMVCPKQNDPHNAARLRRRAA